MVEVSAVQIRSLQGRDADFVELLRHLLHVEAFTHGLARGGIHVTAQITVADGGEDGRIEWNGGPSRTDYLPARFTLFQIKATQMGKADCKSELVNRKTKALKPAIQEVIMRSGTYVVFGTDLCSPPMLKARVDGLKEGFEAATVKPNGANIEFYDANKIAAWVNCYPSVQAWAHQKIDGRCFDGLQSWESWSQNPRLRASSVPFALGKTKSQTLDLARLTADIPRDLAQPRTVVRLIGLSGLGKTRIALEMFRPPSTRDDVAQAARSAAVVYAHSSIGCDQIVRILHQWRTHKYQLIFVVDDCPIDLHRILAEIAGHPDSNFSLMTLDFDLSITNDQSRRIEVTPFDDAVIDAIVKKTCPGLGPSEIDRVKHFADGFPVMAVLLSESLSGSIADWASIQDDLLLKNIVWGRGTENEEGLNVISACSLFSTIGISGNRVSERDFVASSLCQLSSEKFHAWVVHFEDRGLIQRHGDVCLVLPKPVALRLASRRWRGMLPERAEKWFAETGPDAMPSRLLDAMCEQLSYLNFIPDARGFVERLCGPSGPFGRPAALETEGGSRALRFLVDTNPDTIMLALERAFGDRTQDDLRGIESRARRNIMWALEKLVFRIDHFSRSAALLLSFAVAETESYANSATGIFSGLYHIYLSGTAANGQAKLAFADEVLASNDLRSQAILVRALTEGLQTVHFTRFGGADVQGSAPPLHDWEPTAEEMSDYLHGTLKRLTQVAVTPGVLSQVASDGIAQHLRGLIGLGPVLFEAVDAAIREIVEKCSAYWPKALESVIQSLQYEGPGFPQEYRRRVESLRDLMLPRSLADRLHFHVTNLPWGIVHGDLNEVEADARRLADEISGQPDSVFSLLSALSAGEQRQSSIFGHRLGIKFYDPGRLLSSALTALAAAPSGNPAFVGGLIGGLDERDPELVRSALDRCAREEGLRKFLAYLTCRKRVASEDLARLISEIDNDRLPVSELLNLRLGRALDHLEPREVEPVVDAALRKKGGRIVAVEIIGMYAHGRPERSGTLRELMFRALSAPAPLTEAVDDIASYNLEALVGTLLKDREYGPKIANLIAHWAIAACGASSEHRSRETTGALLATALQSYPELVWPILKRGIADANPVSRYYLEGMLENRYRHKDSPGILFFLSVDVLLAWCREAPEFAPQFVVSIAPPLVRANDNSESWSPIISMILDEFGTKDRVLAALGRNIGTFSNWGSLVPYYTRFVEPLETLTRHRVPNVKRWARRMLAAHQKMIEDEIKIDKETKIGVY